MTTVGLRREHFPCIPVSVENIKSCFQLQPLRLKLADINKATFCWLTVLLSFLLCHPTTGLWKEVYLSSVLILGNSLISRSRFHTCPALEFNSPQCSILCKNVFVFEILHTVHFTQTYFYNNNYFVKTSMTLISYLHIFHLFFVVSFASFSVDLPTTF